MRVDVEQQEGMPSDRMVLNLGPSHPAMHGTLRVVVELDGEIIRKATPEIGYLHRGMEKLSEHRTYPQILPLTDRLNYVSALMNNIGYIMAVEKLLGIEVTPRAQRVRLILCELSRIADHVVCVGINAVDIGAMTPFLYIYHQREIIYDIFEKLTGARLHYTYPRVGGMAADLYPGFEDEIKAFLDGFPKPLDDLEALLTRNRIWVDRTRDVGVISAEDALDYGFTGPCLRATGVSYDIRRDRPYLGYEDFDFQVPVGTNGDIYDRYLVRIEEMRQSMVIIRQALEGIPEGPINIDDPKIFLPEKELVYTQMEELIHHFKIIMHGVMPPRGEVYFSTEAANGELGFYIASEGGPKPDRLHIRGPCFAIFQAFPKMIEGRFIADVIGILGSMNIIAGELDR